MIRRSRCPLRPSTRLRFAATVNFFVCVAGLFLSANSVAQSTLVYTANYDVKLIVAGETSHITSQARVRDKSTIPIDFQEHRIDVTVTNSGSGRYSAFVDVFEKTESDWNRINTEDLSFEAVYGAPVQIQWSDDGISMDFAIAVSILHR